MSINPNTQDILNFLREYQKTATDEEGSFNAHGPKPRRMQTCGGGNLSSTLISAVVATARTLGENRVRAEEAMSNLKQAYNEYEKAKKVTQERMFLETMEQVLADINKIIIDKNSGSGVVPYLPLQELKTGTN